MRPGAGEQTAARVRKTARLARARDLSTGPKPVNETGPFPQVQLLLPSRPERSVEPDPGKVGAAAPGSRISLPAVWDDTLGITLRWAPGLTSLWHWRWSSGWPPATATKRPTSARS